MVASLRPDDVARLRLQSQALVNSSFAKPVDVVRHMLAIQAQDFGAGKWAIGVRAPGTTMADVAKALDAGKIIRSWPMRGTLHFVPPEDLHWILELTTARLLKGVTTRHQRLELDAKDLNRATTIATKLLTGNKRATREQLMAALEAGGIGTSGQRSYHLVWYLAQTGLVCWGPTHEKQQALVLLDEWVPKPRRFERDEALGEFVRRYFAGHGPATLKDFSWWTKVTQADAKIGLAVARKDLTELSCNGTTYWMTTKSYDHADAKLAVAKSSVLVLPAFDEHLLGYQDRNLVLDPEFAPRIVPGNNGMFLPTIVAGGHVVGTWKRKSTVKATTIAVDPFAALPKRVVAGIGAAADHYGDFLGVDVTVATKN